jgi:flagellin-like protein
MTGLRKIRRDKKGINTILAALLMVVIVVVAAVMVYAWATGLLSSLLVQNPVPKESLNYDSVAFTNSTALTIYIRNSGSAAVSLQTYYVKNATGAQYTQSNSGPWNSAGGVALVMQPNAVQATVISIATGCSPACTPSTVGGFTTFIGGNSYTITVVTTRNNQFTWQFTK